VTLRERRGLGATHRARAPGSGGMPAPAEERREAKAGWSSSQRAALALTYLGYATCMLCKSAVDVAVPVAQLDAAMALSHAATARMLSAGNSAYTVGKLLGGGLTDALGGGRMLTLTSLVTAASFTVISRARSLSALTAAWALARLFMAAGYPAGTAICDQHFQGNGLGLALGVFSTSSRVGAVLGSVCLGTLLSPSVGLSWRGVLGVSAGLSLAVGAAVEFSPALKQLPVQPPVPAKGAGNAATTAETDEADKGADAEAAAERVVTRTAGEAISALARSGRLWLIFASTACLGPAFDLGALLPLYLTQTHQLSPAAAAVMSGAYPLGAALSLIVSGWLYDRMKPKQRAGYFGSLLVMAVGSLTFLARRGAGTTPKWLLASCLFTTMFGVAPTLYLPNSALILRLAGRYSGTVMGINDLPGTALAAVWLGAYPTLLRRGGWTAVLLPIQLLLASSAVCTVSYLTLEANSPTQRIV
jgi:sugar phosphate permease